MCVVLKVYGNEGSQKCESFLFYRKAKTLREDAHCDVQCKCRKRPPQARECAKTHSLFFHRKASFKKRLVVDEAFLCQCKSVQDCFGLIAQAQLNVIRLSAEVPLTGESLHSGQ